MGCVLVIITQHQGRGMATVVGIMLLLQAVPAIERKSACVKVGDEPGCVPVMCVLWEGQDF